MQTHCWGRQPSQNFQPHSAHAPTAQSILQTSDPAQSTTQIHDHSETSPATANIPSDLSHASADTTELWCKYLVVQSQAGIFGKLRCRQPRHQDPTQPCHCVSSTVDGQLRHAASHGQNCATSREAYEVLSSPLETYELRYLKQRRPTVVDTPLGLCSMLALPTSNTYNKYSGAVSSSQDKVHLTVSQPSTNARTTPMLPSTDVSR